MPRYTYLAADLLSGTVRDELPFETASFALVMNSTGGFSGTMPLKSDALTHLSLAGTLERGKTAIYVLRDGLPVWGGIYWGLRASVEQNSLQVAAQDWLSYFDRREIRSTKTYTATDQFTIFSTLVSYAQGLPGGDLNIDVVYDALSGVARDRTFPFWEAKNLGEALRQLAEVEDGFEFQAETSGTGLGDLTRSLRLSYPRRGRRTDLIFELGKNIELIDFDDDTFAMTNDLVAHGSGEGYSMLQATATDPNKISQGYPLLQASRAYKDVTVQSTLQAHASEDLLNAKSGISGLRVQLKATDPDSTFGSFITGDEVRVRGTWGLLDIAGVTEWWRIMETNVTVNESSDESVTCLLTPAEATLD